MSGFFANSYVANVLSNLISAVVSVALVAVGVKGWHMLLRRRFLNFFGNEQNRQVIIYTSRLYVKSGGALGAGGVERRFEGVATPDYEARIAANIESFFGRFAPRIRWRGVPLLRWTDIRVRTSVSPETKVEIEKAATLIVIGSPGYNSVATAVEEDFDVKVVFAEDNTILVHRDAGPLDKTARLGMVQRITNQTTGQTVFYLAGPSTPGTIAAATYLLREWRQLAKRHRAMPFHEIVRATNADGDQYVVAPNNS